MANNKEKDFISGYVYTPGEFATIGLESVKAIKEDTSRSLKIGIPSIDKYFAPLLPGQVCAVIAQTSQYKSGFLHFVEHVNARQIQDEGREEILIHVSVEETIEEQSYLEFARLSHEDPGKLAVGDVQDWGKLESASYKVAGIPIYRVGDSLARPGLEHELYLTNLIRAVRYIQENMSVTIAGLYFDYLQAFPIDPEIKGQSHDQQRRLQVRSDIYRLKQAANYFKCPVWVAVQAKQHLDGAPSQNFQMPGIYDGEESSSIAQRVDRIVQLWMPKMTNPVGSTVKISNDLQFTVSENLLFLKVGKQRGGLPSGRIWQCRVNFRTNTIAPEAIGFEDEG